MPLMTIFLVVFASLGVLVQEAEAAWLTGWNYRRLHDIIGTAAGDQSDYQMRVRIHRSSGVDSGEDVYVGSDCRADFGDIRFTASDGSTQLSYWLEDISGSVATFWVKIPYIPISGSTGIYMYYDNPGVATTSSGAATFEFFDDFPGSGLGAQWNYVSGSPTVGGGVLEINSGDRIRSTGQGFLHPKRVMFRARATAGVEPNARSRIGLSNATLGQDYWSGDAAYVQIPYDTQIRRISADGGATTGVNMQAATQGQWYVIQIDWESDGSVMYSIDGDVPQQSSSRVPDQTLYPRIECTATVNTIAQVDWYFISDYASPEPTHGGWYEQVPPIWNDASGRLGMNLTTVSRGAPVRLYAELKDNTALDWAWLSTDETGTWKNYSLPHIDQSWVNATGLVGLWHLNDISGGVTPDSSGYGNDGTVQASGRNQVKNPSFENDKQDWGGSGTGTWDIVTDEVYHESKASRFQDLVGDIGHEITGNVYIPVTPGQDITISLYSKGDNIVEGPGANWYYALLIGRWCDATFYCPNNPYPDLPIGDRVGTWDWKRSSRVATAPANVVGGGPTQYYRFTIGMRGDSTGTLWADGVQIEYGDTLTVFTDSPLLPNDECKFGSCFEFDGEDDYVDMGSPGVLDITDTVTVSAWVRPNDRPAPSASWWGIAGKRNSHSTAYGYALVMGSYAAPCARWCFRVNDQSVCPSTACETLGEWDHIVGVYNGTDILLYQNGELKGSAPYSGAIGVSSNTMKMGFVNGYRYFEGDIDDVGVWDRALSGEEVHELYTGKYESPMYMDKDDSWQWSNFTWNNPNIPSGALVKWKVYFNDTSGNENVTEEWSFKVSPQIPNITYLSYSGEVGKMEVSWVTEYNQSSVDTVDVQCKLNDDDGKNCQYLGDPGTGGCTITQSGLYDLTPDAGGGPKTVMNTLNCTACNHYDSTMCDEWIETFYPVSFEASMPNEVTLPIGDVESIPITVRNNGILTDNYTINLVSMNPSALNVINGSQMLEMLATSDVQRVGIEIVMLTSEQKATARMTAISEIAPAVFFQKDMGVVGIERNLPDFGLSGILQIMVVAAVLLGFYYSDISNN